LFLMLPTRGLTGQHVISSEEYGPEHAFSWAASAGSSPSHAGHVSLQDRRQAIVDLAARLVGLRRDDREAAHSFTRRGAPFLPQTSKGHQPTVRQRNPVG